MEATIPAIKTEAKYKDYHFLSLILSVMLICLTPFTTPYLSFVPFAIQLVRLVGCKPEVFLSDLSCLLVFSNIFREPGGKSLYSMLILAACAWFAFTKKFKPNVSLMLCLILVGYLITRSISNFTSSLLAISGVLIIYLVSVFLNRENALLASKVYVISVLFASAFGLIFKDSSALIKYTRDPDSAVFNSATVRFKGLFQDPNYYASCVIIAVALIIVLYIIKEIDIVSFVVGFMGLTLFGFLTYSKAFLIVYIVACVFYMAVSVKRKRFVLFFLFGLLFLIILFNFASESIEFFAIMRERFGETDDLNSVTSGRANAWENYLNYIFSDVRVFLVGDSLDAGMLNSIGTHNIIIELLYYTGIIGLILFICFFWSVISNTIKNNSDTVKHKNGLMKYGIIAIFVIFYFSLQAIFFSTMYAQWILVAAGVLLSDGNINSKTIYSQK